MKQRKKINNKTGKKTADQFFLPITDMNVYVQVVIKRLFYIMRVNPLWLRKEEKRKRKWND